MKEELRDLEGKLLFPPRFAETIPIALTPLEQAAYTAVMDYTDAYYGETATLARSIYGKRAASSFVAAVATIRRRQAALKGPANARSDAAPPEEFEGLEGELSLAVEDDDVWQRAETAIVASKSKDKKAELAAIDG